MDKHRDMLIREINNAPKILKDYIHSLDSFQYSEVIIDLFAAEEKLKIAMAAITDLKKIKQIGQ